MNKKLFLGLFTVAGMLFTTSCSNDELNTVQSSDEAQVIFTLATEGSIATRAISDGTGAKKLICAVYDAYGNVLNTININNTAVNGSTGQYVNEKAFQNGLKDQINVTLAKGQEYTMVFWAQNLACDAYDTDDLTAVVVDYTDGNGNGDINNDDTRDAFYAAETFKVEGNKEINVTLKRPFAQINVGVTAEDWEAAVASGITIKQSSVEIKNVADEINLLTGAVKASEAMKDGITYTVNATPNDPAILKADANGDGTPETYQWISMSYILVNDDDTSVDENGLLGTDNAVLESLQFTFVPENGQTIVFEDGLAGVPVRRNWRTNILGKILTGDIQFNITIDPAYNDDYIYPDGTVPQELEFAATFGGTYTLKEDLTLPFLEVGGDFIFNIEEDITLTSGSATSYGIIVYDGTTTINSNGTIDSKGGGIGVVNGAEVIFNSGNLSVDTESTSGRYLFYLENEGSTVTINGGNFSWDPADNQKRAYIYAGTGTTAYVNGGTFGKASTRSGYTDGILGAGSVIITGGTFGFDPSRWVADGYQAVKNGSKWYVVSKDVDAIVANSEELKTAVANGASNICLLDGEYDIKDCKGKTITINGGKDAVINVVGGGQGEANGQLDYDLDGSTVTFKGVTIKTNGQTYAGYARLTANYINCHFENCYCLNGNSSFENCTFNQLGNQYNIWTWGAPTATFANCTFNCDGKSVLLYGQVDTKLTMNDCTFNDNGGLDDLKAAIEIGNDYNKSYELIVNNATVNGFEINTTGINTNTTLWANKNSMPQDKLNVVVDGVDVY